ncbi:MAG: hypothetical protein ACE5H2_04315 [Terriglobia bacterium]
MPTATFGLALLLALGPAPRFFAVNAVELDVRLEPADAQLAAKASLALVSRRVRPIHTLVLVFPAPFHDRARIRTVWDETGLLAWHTEPAKDALLIHVTFASPLAPLARRTVVVSFELDFAGLDSTAPAHLSDQEARLESSGWYPLPESAAADRLRRLRLDVRLPRTWRVERSGPIKHLRTGIQFAEYELKRKNIPAGRLLFRAYAE